MSYLGLGCTNMPMLMSHTSPHGFKSYHGIMPTPHPCRCLWLSVHGEGLAMVGHTLHVSRVNMPCTWGTLMSYVRANLAPPRLYQIYLCFYHSFLLQSHVKHTMS